MLRGDAGPLKNDIQQLVDWLQAEVRPDVVHLSNVMLAGLALPLGRRLGVPVIATLSGEDSFLEKLPAPDLAQARAELRGGVADLAGLVAMCRFYADFMADYLAVPREKIDVIRPGLNLAGHAEQREAGGHENARPKIIGFFGRICADKGLHLLVDALHAMREAGNVPPYRLRVAGYLDHADRAYLAEMRKRVPHWDMADRFEYAGELDRAGKIAFLRSLDVLCLPSLIRESKGLSALEAWASGVPAVLPDHGASRSWSPKPVAGCSTIRNAPGRWRRPWAACCATRLSPPNVAAVPGMRCMSATRRSANRGKCWPCMSAFVPSGPR